MRRVNGFGEEASLGASGYARVRAKPVTGDTLDAIQGVQLSLWHGTDVARLSYVARLCVFVVVTCTWTDGSACVLTVSYLRGPSVRVRSRHVHMD